MSFITCGLNYRTAPLALREKFVFSREKLVPMLSDLRQGVQIDEAVLLSTCHRTEMYCHSDSSPQQIIERMAAFHAMTVANIMPYLYVYKNEEMVRHVFRVASGVDSAILGEPQIFGQLKAAVKISEAAGMLGKNLKQLFQRAFSVGKQVRANTKIGVNPVTLGYATLHLAKHIFSDLSACRVLCVGAGETAQLIVKYLCRHNVKHLCIANRTVVSAQSFADSVQASVISLSDIPQQLAQTDILVTAVQSELPIIGKGFIESALKQRKRRPMLIVDVGMPRNVEPEIQQLEDVYLYGLHDLHHILEENYHKRKDALPIAEEMITTQVDHFVAQLQTLQVAAMIKKYRSKYEGIRDEVLALACHELAIGDNPKEVLERFSHRLSNKFMHQPSVALRQAAYSANAEIVDVFEKLFI